MSAVEGTGRQGGSGRSQTAHSWTKETVGWVQQVAKDADGSWPSEPDDVLRQLRRRMNGPSRGLLSFPQSLPSPSPKSAPGSFEAVTLVTDGFHSSHLQILSDEALGGGCPSCFTQPRRWATCRVLKGRSSWPYSEIPQGVQTHRTAQRDVPDLGQGASPFRSGVAKRLGWTQSGARPSGHSTLTSTMAMGAHHGAPALEVL